MCSKKLNSGYEASFHTAVFRNDDYGNLIYICVLNLDNNNNNNNNNNNQCVSTPTACGIDSYCVWNRLLLRVESTPTACGMTIFINTIKNTVNNRDRLI